MQNSQKKLKVAEIGLGWVTTHRHLPAMRRSRDIEVVGVIDRTPGHAKAVAQQYGLQRWREAERLDQIPWLDEIDALVIGTPVFSHYELIRESLRGKHVLCEKPFTLRIEEGEELTALSKQAGKAVAIVHNFQFCRSARRLLRDLETGRLGTVRSITAWQMGNPRRRLPDWYQQLPLGLFFDESPHLFYLLQRFSPGPLVMRLHRASQHDGNGHALQYFRQYTAKRLAAGPRFPSTCCLTLRVRSASGIWPSWAMRARWISTSFRDIYIHLPNDGRHDMSSVFRTSALAAMQHFGQHFSRGLLHLTGGLLYGNRELFDRFARAALSGRQPEFISAETRSSSSRCSNRCSRRPVALPLAHAISEGNRSVAGNLD